MIRFHSNRLLKKKHKKRGAGLPARASGAPKGGGYAPAFFFASTI
jgi:hypothetical protein